MNVETLSHAARALLREALQPGSDAAAAAVAQVPAAAWPDAETRLIGEAITCLRANGDPVEIPLIMEQFPAQVPDGFYTAFGEICGGDGRFIRHPDRYADRLISEHEERTRQQQKKELAGRVEAMTEPEIRDAVDSIFTEKQPDPFCDDLTDWRTIAETPVDWTFAQAIPAGCVTVIGGRGGTGKSTLTRTLALSCITGRRLMRTFAPAKTGPALILSGEDAANIFLGSIRDVAAAFSIDDTPLDSAIRDRLHIRCGRPEPLITVDKHGALMRTTYAETVRREAKARGVALLVIDTLRLHCGAPENDNAAAGFFMQVCADIARFAGCAVVVNHHVNKGGTGSGTDLRGGSAVHDEARSVILLHRDEDDRLELRHAKSNYSAPFLPVEVAFDGAALIEVSRDPLVVAEAVSAWLTENPEAVVTETGVRQNQGTSARELARYIAKKFNWCDREALTEAIADGIDAGILQIGPRKRSNRQTEQQAIIPCTTCEDFA